MNLCQSPLYLKEGKVVYWGLEQSSDSHLKHGGSRILVEILFDQAYYCRA